MQNSANTDPYPTAAEPFDADDYDDNQKDIASIFDFLNMYDGGGYIESEPEVTPKFYRSFGGGQTSRRSNTRLSLPWEFRNDYIDYRGY